ncbi:hypothetical protein R69608_04772 [Paraburkholderia nemoris]|uniref:hypothetical protein n=1 Tax=Paraburkholderia nemoris TaxID=2793076 RepID=UPI001B1BE0C1|nr:hypothetical protein [Paraburkholderia nemoris]CAE6774855.1 hypothetical protein LMG22931_04232 [Paraburkholderia nemoris]CAE6932850.1 hypothetical protein R69608_04772 [Paraburkholderia nemoris]
MAALAAAGVTLRAHAAPADPFAIVYPHYRPEDWARAIFPLAVLDLAMKAAGADYVARQADVLMERGRALAELAGGSNAINLLWTSTDAEAERGLNVVRIPINRGLIGHRIFVIRKDRQADFDRVGSLADLKALTGGQGLGWIDTKIMRAAGLNIETVPYETVFDMVQGGRLDYFPRGAIEAFAELDEPRHRDRNLVVEKRLLLKYRSDFIFYVSTKHASLAQTINKGLEKAYLDGSFMRLFNSHPYIQDGLLRSNLASRKVFVLDNPYLSEEDRRIPDKYWMS